MYLVIYRDCKTNKKYRKEFTGSNAPWDFESFMEASQYEDVEFLKVLEEVEKYTEDTREPYIATVDATWDYNATRNYELYGLGN